VHLYLFTITNYLMIKPSLGPDQRFEQSDGSLALACRLYDAAETVQVPLDLGPHRVLLRAAIIGGADLERILPGETFGGFRGPYVFLSRTIDVPGEFGKLIPTLMAINVLSKLALYEFESKRIYLPEDLPIALELSYAKRKLGLPAYERYLDWRKGIERSDFFERVVWERKVGEVEKEHRNYLQLVGDISVTNNLVLPRGKTGFRRVKQWVVKDGGIDFKAPPTYRQRS